MLIKNFLATRTFLVCVDVLSDAFNQQDGVTQGIILGGVIH